MPCEHVRVITPGEDGMTIRAYARGLMHVSGTRFARMKFNNGVFLDGLPAYANDIIHTGQTLVLAERERPPYIPEPYALEIPILYEDEHYIVLDKPAPLACQAGSGRQANTLENAMAYRCASQALQGFIFRPVNRLDKGTSGLMTAAKSGYAHALLQEQFRSGTFRRAYLAVTRGVPQEREGLIDLPIGRADGSIILRETRADGREARTGYRVTEENGRYALLRLELLTGRTHQIRVHLSAIGCPVAGDYLYGTEEPSLPGRFALHSSLVAFRHPMTGEAIKIESPLPRELAGLVNQHILSAYS